MLVTTSIASDADARAALRRVLTLVLADDWGQRAYAEQAYALLPTDDDRAGDGAETMTGSAHNESEGAA